MERKRFFFEKKKQKTFSPFASRPPGETPQRMDKSFFGSFFSKKEPLAYFL